ncbi:hypothetical protein LQZ21_04420 [Treponema sp. TIM-1]|uniref:hypothetical protein n=1 Tax=Treponema sp. TIM-1 TaxID=2898417 RepID=UPI00397FF743
MEAKRNVLIVTDGTEATRKLGEKIARELRGSRVVIKKTPELSATDILPADVYFFGCESPHPPSFTYLEQVLLHINLVGRPCGLFSPQSPAAVQYLGALVRDSELDLRAEPFLGVKSEDLAAWIQKTIK